MMHWVSRRCAFWSIVITVLVWLFLIGAVTVGAQATATPIILSENVTGSITDPSSAALYTIELGAPQSVTVLVLAVTPGFAPTLRVLDPSGIVVLDSANPGTQTIAQGMPNLSSSGIYTIEVRSANDTVGQFLISVQPGPALAPPTVLTLGTPLSGSVDAQTTRQDYSFSGSATDVLLLTVHSEDLVAGAVIALRDADTDESLSLSSARLGGIRYRILTGETNYLLEVTHNGASTAQAFSVCLAPESSSTLCSGDSAGISVMEATAAPILNAVAPTLAPMAAAINPAGACQVASAGGQSINVRGGAGTNFGVVTQLAPNTTAPVIGRLADNSWFQVNVSSVIGWVSASVVTLGGTCTGVSVIAQVPPAPVIVVPTNAPTTNAPTTEPTDLPPEVPTDAPRINAGADPEYVVNLQGQGTIVYFDYTIASLGGDVDASYLGGCAGIVSAQPTLYINLTDPLPGLLRFYFVHNDATDPVMIIQDPEGHIQCSDDSYGTVNPTIDLNGPSGGFPRTSPPSAGRYYIWIGTHSIPTIGTLYVTNSEDYHP